SEGRAGAAPPTAPHRLVDPCTAVLPGQGPGAGSMRTTRWTGHTRPPTRAVDTTRERLRAAERRRGNPPQQPLRHQGPCGIGTLEHGGTPVAGDRGGDLKEAHR